MNLSELIEKIDATVNGVGSLVKQIRESDTPLLSTPQEKAGAMQLIVSSTPVIIAGYVKEYIEQSGAASKLVLATSMPKEGANG